MKSKQLPESNGKSENIGVLDPINKQRSDFSMNWKDFQEKH